jgi:hypothetical protein
VNYRYAVIPAPSALGLRVDGVARAPAALLGHGLADTLGARVRPPIAAPRGDGRIDPRARVLNADAITAYAVISLRRSTPRWLVTSSRSSSAETAASCWAR